MNILHLALILLVDFDFFTQFAVIRKIASFSGLPEEVETEEVEIVGMADQMSPKRRRFLSGRKRIGRMARLILCITPYRLQCALGYRTTESIGKNEGSDGKNACSFYGSRICSSCMMLYKYQCFFLQRSGNLL